VPRFACINRLEQSHLMRFNKLNLIISFSTSLKDDLILMFIEYLQMNEILMLQGTRIVKRYSINHRLISEAMLIPKRYSVLFLQGSTKTLDQPAEGKSVLCFC